MRIHLSMLFVPAFLLAVISCDSMETKEQACVAGECLACSISCEPEAVAAGEALVVRVTFQNVSGENYWLLTNVWFWSKSTSMMLFLRPEEGEVIEMNVKKRLPPAEERGEVELQPGAISLLSLRLPTENLAKGRYEAHVRYTSTKNRVTSYIGQPPHPFEYFDGVWTGEVISNKSAFAIK